MPALKTLDDVPVDGRRVLLRCDFNVTVGPDRTVDQFEDYRLEAALTTINELRQRRCKIILLTHRGEPQKNPQDNDLSPIHYRLEELLGETVKKTTRLFGPEVQAVTDSLEPGGMLLLPNVRADIREETNNPKFAQELARLADVYVNEAFSVCHREHASVALIPTLLPGAAGRWLAKEYAVLTRLRENPTRPYVAITSGAKITTKIHLLRNLLGQVEQLCIGGDLANVFLAAQGKGRTTRYNSQEITAAQAMLAEHSASIVLPVDVVTGPREGGSETATILVDDIPDDGGGIWDIGPQSVELFLSHARRAKTIMWNGPVGMQEVPPYERSTNALAQALAQLPAYRVVGGGDTVIALERARLRTKFDHVSVGGGAMVAFLEGQTMPGLVPLFSIKPN